MTKYTYYVPCGDADDHTRIGCVSHHMQSYGPFETPEEAFKCVGHGHVMKVEVSMMTPVVTFKDGV